MEENAATTADVNNDNDKNKDSKPQPEPAGKMEGAVAAPGALKKAFRRIVPSGKRDKLFVVILLAIVLVWIAVWATNRGYPFWSGLAGVLTIPLLLAALMVDNLYKE